MFDHIQSVRDLPQLHQNPSYQSLIEALQLLAIPPPSWEVLVPSQHSTDFPSSYQNINESTSECRYLTSIISSPLSWISDETRRERIWEMASLRLCERSGRTALPQMSRTFTVSEEVIITLHEPSLTSDNLGLKTWAASFLLAKRLKRLPKPDKHANVLELGAGTGLVGIAAASVWGVRVHLTDLKEIVPNLERNVQANREMIESNGGKATTGFLDWEEEKEADSDEERYDLILVSDPLYSPRHPMLLVDTVCRWLKRECVHSTDARVVVELPLRDAYMKEVTEFQSRMMEKGLVILDQGEEVGLDDWEDGGAGAPGDDETRGKVRCWWSVWAVRA